MKKALCATTLAVVACLLGTATAVTNPQFNKLAQTEWNNMLSQLKDDSLDAVRVAEVTDLDQ